MWWNWPSSQELSYVESWEDKIKGRKVRKENWETKGKIMKKKIIKLYKIVRKQVQITMISMMTLNLWE